MSLIPKQPLADDEVIAFWLDKPKLSRNEIVQLVIGLNPLAFKNNNPICLEKKQDVEDIYFLLSHKLGIHEWNNSLAIEEWREILKSLSVDMPNWLKEYKSKDELEHYKKQEKLIEISRTLTPEQKANNKKELAETLEKIKKSQKDPVLIHDWFAYDNWNKDDAMMLLVGLDPSGTVLKEISDEYLINDGARVLELEVAYMLNCKEMIPRSLINEYGDDKDDLFYRKINREWGFISSVFDSGTHPSRNPPSYYINWAISKSFQIPWLNYAIKEGLYTPKNHEKTDKAIHVRTENNYLRLILALANGINGFNPKKPYEAAQLILDETEINISKETLAGYVSKAYDLESKNRD